MRDDEKWPLVHTYRRAVAQGKALPIRCPDCETEMVPVVDADQEPALKCFTCRSVFNIGLYVYDQMLNALVGVELELLREENDEY